MPLGYIGYVLEGWCSLDGCHPYPIAVGDPVRRRKGDGLSFRLHRPRMKAPVVGHISEILDKDLVPVKSLPRWSEGNYKVTFLALESSLHQAHK